MLLFNVII